MDETAGCRFETANEIRLLGDLAFELLNTRRSWDIGSTPLMAIRRLIRVVTEEVTTI